MMKKLVIIALVGASNSCYTAPKNVNHTTPRQEKVLTITLSEREVAAINNANEVSKTAKTAATTLVAQYAQRIAQGDLTIDENAHFALIEEIMALHSIEDNVAQEGKIQSLSKDTWASFRPSAPAKR